jgi:MGT family glycosyltransferase
MPRIVVAASPMPGHVAPLLTVAGSLVERGHDVTMLTGSVFRHQVAATGARAVDLPGEADFDGNDLDAVFPARGNYAPGPDQLNFDIAAMFADFIPAQHAALQELLTDGQELLVMDPYFLGAWPVLLGAPGVRPARSTAIGISVVSLPSDDTTVMGPIPGLEGEAARQAHREANAGLAAALAPSQAHLAGVLAQAGVKGEVPFILDGLFRVPDNFAQLTVEEFEFARGDAPATLHFVGPLPAADWADYEKPGWWAELGQGRPVIAITQGTLANTDLSLLIEPALEALAAEDALVIVTTGRQSERLAGRVPANTRVEDFVPYDLLMPHLDVLITNGGYGTVQKALLAGVPMVIGGATEDKPFVAARVAAAGAGIDLGPAPAAEAIQAAVRKILTDPSVRQAGQPIAAAIAASDPLGAIARLVTGQ